MVVHFIAMRLQGYISMASTPCSVELGLIINQKTLVCQPVWGGVTAYYLMAHALFCGSIWMQSLKPASHVQL